MERHSESIGFGGFSLLTVQWCMTDMLMLRGVGVLVASSMIVLNYFRPSPIMLTVRFNALFICINAVAIACLLNEWRDVDLEPLEQTLFASTFEGWLSKLQTKCLLSTGQVEFRSGGEVHVRIGDPVSERVVLICEGGACLLNGHGEQVAQARTGDFLGEGRVVRGGRRLHGETESATIVFSKDSVVVEWEVEALLRHLDTRPEVKNGVQMICARQLAEKLESALRGGSP